MAQPRAKKSLGQNFLADHSVADRIVESAEIEPGDTVLEIGPGPGVLTGRLADRAARLVAVELDPRFVERLRDRFAERPAVEIVHGDILALAPGKVMGGAPYIVVANIPYFITSPILRHLLEAEQPPVRAVLMVQKEVGERICAAPGDLSILGVSVQFYAVPHVLFTVPSGAFRPPPKVDSAVVRLDLRPAPAVTDVAPADFFRVVRAGFGQKRKQLANSLSAGLALGKDDVASRLREAGVDPARRAETLTLQEWGSVAKQFRPAQP